MILKKTMLIFSLLAVTLFGCDATPDYAAYETWDADADEAISEDEFATTYTDVGYFGAWDVDGDGFIEETEWETGIGAYYPTYDYDTYGYYDAWDLNADEMLDENEFITGNYTLWDTDRDGLVESVEYEEWYYGI